MAEDLTLSHEEIVTLTGYKRADAQLAELQRQGFHRARRNAVGAVVLERAHYEAICAGREAKPDAVMPLLKSQRRLAATT